MLYFTEKQKEKRIRKMNRLKNLWDTTRHINMYVMKISGGQEESMLNAPKLTKFDKKY